jgi:hypothetical protein
MPTPVLYPGSVERTAFAEKDEEKGFLLLTLRPSGDGGELTSHEFFSLPARAMMVRDLHPPDGPGGEWSSAELEEELRSVVARIGEDAVLRIRVFGEVPAKARRKLEVAYLRRLSPPDMNLEVLVVDERARRTPGSRRRFRSKDRSVEGRAERRSQLSLMPE